MTKERLIRVLELILADTPDGVAFCVPLRRSTLVAILEALKDANQ